MYRRLLGLRAVLFASGLSIDPEHLSSSRFANKTAAPSHRAQAPGDMGGNLRYRNAPIS
jgi:hypothetical protein